MWAKGCAIALPRGCAGGCVSEECAIALPRGCARGGAAVGSRR